MSESKRTKGKLELKYVGKICIGIGTFGDFSEITANSVIPDTDKEYFQYGIGEEIEANMRLYAASPDMLELLSERLQLIEEMDGRIVNDELTEWMDSHTKRCKKIIEKVNN